MLKRFLIVFGTYRILRLNSAVQMLIDNKVKMPAEIAEDLLLNPSDVESLCSLPWGSLQNKVLSFPTLRQR